MYIIYKLIPTDKDNKRNGARQFNGAWYYYESVFSAWEYAQASQIAYNCRKDCPGSLFIFEKS